MRMQLKHGAILASLLLALAGCSGDDGAAGNDGLGFVPTPAADQILGEYDPASTSDQTVDGQLVDNSGVWQIDLDHALQFDFGGGTAPVIVNSILYDSDHDVVWITVDGVDIAIEKDESLGCLNGSAQVCVRTKDSTLNALIDYAEIATVDLQFGPAIDSQATVVSGVKTSLAEMPTSGTAIYSGSSQFTASYTRPDGSPGSTTQTGVVTINVDFDPLAPIGVDWESAKDSIAFAANSHLLNSTTAVDGNSYSGVLSGAVVGEFFDPNDTLDVTGTVEGSFYGPAADTTGLGSLSETAGLFTFSDNEPDLDPITGFPTSPVGGTDGAGEFVAGQDGVPNPPLLGK